MESYPVKVVIGLGSNCGDRSKAVAEAIDWLHNLLNEAEASDIYETPAYGDVGGPYMNAVVRGVYRNNCTLDRLECECKGYELSHGRDAEARSRNLVPIDIDIVMAGDEILRSADFSRSFFQIGYQQLTGGLR